MKCIVTAFEDSEFLSNREFEVNQPLTGGDKLKIGNAIADMIVDADLFTVRFKLPNLVSDSKPTAQAPALMAPTKHLSPRAQIGDTIFTDAGEEYLVRSVRVSGPTKNATVISYTVSLPGSEETKMIKPIQVATIQRKKIAATA